MYGTCSSVIIYWSLWQCLKADDPQIYNAITDNSVEGLDLFFVDTDYDSSHVLKVGSFYKTDSKFSFVIISGNATEKEGPISPCDR